MIRLEEKIGFVLAGKLSFYIWDYLSRLEEISSELDLESNLEKYQTPLLDTAQIGIDVLIDQFYQSNK